MGVLRLECALEMPMKRSLNVPNRRSTPAISRTMRCRPNAIGRLAELETRAAEVVERHLLGAKTERLPI